MKGHKFNDGKPWWKSKTVWGVVALGAFMALKTLEGAGPIPGSVPEFFSSQYFQALLTGFGTVLTGFGVRDKLQ